MTCFIASCISLIGLSLILAFWLINAPVGHQDDGGYHSLN